jgi:DNA-directed RNA polymerase specialized sigma24 family protein
VLEWKYGDEASVEEIGRLLGIGATAAQSLLARARSAFRETWEQRPHWRTPTPRGPIRSGHSP